MAIVPILYPYVYIYTDNMYMRVYIVLCVLVLCIVTAVEASTSAIQNDGDILLGVG